VVKLRSFDVNSSPCLCAYFFDTILSLNVAIAWFLLLLLQRYRNVKNELEAQQNLERIRMERMTAALAQA